MTRWTGRVTVPLEFAVTVDLDLSVGDDDAAESAALQRLEEYLQTITGDRRGVVVSASGALDGRGFDEFRAEGDHA